MGVAEQSISGGVSYTRDITDVHVKASQRLIPANLAWREVPLGLKMCQKRVIWKYFKLCSCEDGFTLLDAFNDGQ